MARTLLRALAVGLGLATAWGGGVGAEEAVLGVPTTYQSLAAQARSTNAGTDRLAEGASIALPVSLTPPPGTGRVPEGRSRLYGRLALGRRPLGFVLAARSGEGMLALDPEGDGHYGGAGVEHKAVGRAARSHGREVLRWAFPDLALGAVRVDLVVQETLPDLQAVHVVGDAPEPIVLSTSPPQGCAPLGSGTSPTRYGTITVGGRGVAIAFVRGEGDRLTIAFDRNGNGKLGEAGEILPAAVAGREPGATWWQAENVDLGSGRATLALQETPGEASAAVRPAGARRGVVEHGGRTLLLHLLDADLDGTYDSAGDLWWFGPAEHLAQLKRLGPDAMVEADGPVFVEGRPWRLASVDAAGAALLVEAPEGDVGEYFHARAERVNRERWWPVFDAERETFQHEHGIDPNRRRTSAPVTWLHATDLDVALEAARRAGQPVLVDFEADWCAWCKRFDYYVYPDAEVADLLRRFVCVKVNQEFHFSGDFARLGGKTLPFLVFLDSAGLPLRFTISGEDGQPATVSGPPGFQDPATFAGTLRAALAAWQAGR